MKNASEDESEVYVGLKQGPGEAPMATLLKVRLSSLLYSKRQSKHVF